jgi:hypothetical protein
LFLLVFCLQQFFLLPSVFRSDFFYRILRYSLQTSIKYTRI